MSAVVSRRLTITIQQSHDESIRAQLFTTFAAYGTMEAFLCEDSINYDQSIVTVQFQKLSAAEQLQTDAVRSGRKWHVLFQQATPHPSGELLVSARQPFDPAMLTSRAAILQDEEGEGKPSDASDSAALSTAVAKAPLTTSASRKPKGSTDFFEEKLLRAPGRATKEDDVWSAFAARNVVAVQSRCVGPYVGLLRFKDAHCANTFLVSNQLSLAGQHDVYIQFIPPPPTPQALQQPHGPRGSGRAPPMPLHTAIHSLLTCHPLSHLAEGDTVRGFIVEARSTAICVVDAGVVDDTTTSGQSNRSAVLVETHTNFLKSRLRGEVLVQIRNIATTSRAVQATLLQTVNEDLAVVRGSSRLLKGGPAHGQQQQQHGGLSQQPFMNRTRGFHSTQGSSPPSSQDSLTQSQPSSSQPGPSSTKKLAHRLFQSIQQRKADGTLFTGGSTSLSAGASGERISAFPPGLRPFSALLVRVDRVEAGGSDPGLHATSLGPAEGREAGGLSATTAQGAAAAGDGNWPVFIPAALLPSPEGESWHTFAVAGERMTAALLYTVAVGDSRATLRCVASKLEADVRRALALTASTAGSVVLSTELSQRRSGTSLLGGEDGDGYEQTDSQQLRQACEGGRAGGLSSALSVGDSFSATPVRLLEAGDLGTSGTRGHFPGWVMLPSEERTTSLLCVLPQSHAPPSLIAAAASIAAAGTGSTLRTLPPVDIVVSEVVHSSASGHYAVVVDAVSFRAAEESKLEQARREKEASREQVKRRLAAVLGEDAVSGISTSESAAKKLRTDP